MRRLEQLERQHSADYPPYLALPVGDWSDEDLEEYCAQSPQLQRMTDAQLKTYIGISPDDWDLALPDA